MKSFVLFMSFIAVFFSYSVSFANDMQTKEIIRSSTYGVLAGTLVGAATLAFTDQPGDNLNRVARGASLGLYAGIALGLYVAYIVPNQNEPEVYEGPEIPEEGSLDDYGMNQPLIVYPYISKNGIDGLAAQYQLATF